MGDAYDLAKETDMEIDEELVTSSTWLLNRTYRSENINGLTLDDWQAGMGSLAEQSHPNQMYSYAMSCVDVAEKAYWLREAAHEGHVPAMFDYAQMCTDASRKSAWLTRAANAGHLDAAYQLARECQSLADKRRWLQMGPKMDTCPPCTIWP
jgi:hypothetical protein